MTRLTLPPHLVRHGNIKRCSACNHPFADDVQPSLSRAFRKHVEDIHRSKSAGEDDRKLTMGFTPKK